VSSRKYVCRQSRVSDDRQLRRFCISSIRYARNRGVHRAASVKRKPVDSPDTSSPPGAIPFSAFK
jgi:hypothetical protein